MTREQKTMAAQTKARHTRFMAGWDAAIACKDKSANPYTREDYRATWDNGFKMCMEGRPLPSWYPEWRNGERIGRSCVCRACEPTALAASEDQ